MENGAVRLPRNILTHLQGRDHEPDGLIRLPVELEAVDDLIADSTQAFEVLRERMVSDIHHCKPPIDYCLGV